MLRKKTLTKPLLPPKKTTHYEQEDGRSPSPTIFNSSSVSICVRASASCACICTRQVPGRGLRDGEQCCRDRWWCRDWKRRHNNVRHHIAPEQISSVEVVVQNTPDRHHDVQRDRMSYPAPFLQHVLALNPPYRILRTPVCSFYGWTTIQSNTAVTTGGGMSLYQIGDR